MNQDNISASIGENYADLIVFYLNRLSRLKKYEGEYIHYMNEAFAVVHIPASQITEETVITYGYAAIPKLYGLESEISLEASGVKRLRAAFKTDSRGAGVLIGIIDTGIDYTNPVFLKADGTTKIVSIWDQTIETGIWPYETQFGTEYRDTQINQALASGTPLDIVPSVDETGHGTMMAGVAVGNENMKVNFAGVAPAAELVVVKLRQAKAYLRDFYSIPENAICYQENHIMWGVQYCFLKAQDLKRPIVICLGLGSSQGSHDGLTPLGILLSIIGDFPRTAVVVSAGNEGNRGRHFYGTIDPAIGYQDVEFNVGNNDSGFSMELWGTSPGIFSLSIISPSGEAGSSVFTGLRGNRRIYYIFDKTQVYIDYQLAESLTGEQLILLRFRNITPGIWRFTVYSYGDLPASFHIWMPMGDFISTNTYFIQPNINTTVTEPGNASVPICVTAYNTLYDSLYLNASRGYTRNNIEKPEIAAPGVDYIAPNQNQEFANYTGTGVATAHTAGIVALVLEWGVVKGNQEDLDTLAIKHFLERGAKRNPNLTYPNPDWGYGILDIYNVFDVLRLL